MNSSFTKNHAVKLAQLYRTQLMEIMEEWAAHTPDVKNGGYLTNFDEHWKLTSHEKNIWAQARQCYIFAALYSQIDTNSKWLALARLGRDFLVAHAYAGKGRWNYCLSSDGTTILEGTTTLFTDLFVLAALSQYAVASGSLQDLFLIEETFQAAQRNVADPNFKDIAPHQWQENVLRHSPYMIALNAAGVAGQALGRPTVQPFIDLCTNRLLGFFGQNQTGFLLESLCKNGQVWNTPEGRLVNPGHIFEGMWFAIAEAERSGNNNVLPQALQIIDATCTKALDLAHGGLLHRFDCYDLPLAEQLSTDTGVLRPNDKVDWVHCESLYCFALAAVRSKSDTAWQRFWALHQYCQTQFRPAHGGDWYPLLAADGRVLHKNKGGKHRVAFHVPRALMNLTLLFEQGAEPDF